MFVSVPGCSFHAPEHGLRGFAWRGVEGRQLEVLLLPEVDADQGVQPVEQLLERVDVVDVGTLEPLDTRDDRLVVVDHRAAASEIGSAVPTSQAK